MIEPVDHSNRLEVYQREDGLWAWRLIVHENIVATDHNQGYENLVDAQSMAERILSGEFRDAPTWRIDDD